MLSCAALYCASEVVPPMALALMARAIAAEIAVIVCLFKRIPLCVVVDSRNRLFPSVARVRLPAHRAAHFCGCAPRARRSQLIESAARRRAVTREPPASASSYETCPVQPTPRRLVAWCNRLATMLEECLNHECKRRIDGQVERLSRRQWPARPRASRRPHDAADRTDKFVHSNPWSVIGGSRCRCSDRHAAGHAKASVSGTLIDAAIHAARRDHMADASFFRTTNRVLAALPFLEWRRLEPQLELVELQTGAMLYESGVVLQHVYFPATAVVSLVSSMQDGASVEVAVVGSEGVVGVCAFMGGGHALSSAVVQSAGHALRMTARSIAGACQSLGAIDAAAAVLHAGAVHAHGADLGLQSASRAGSAVVPLVAAQSRPAPGQRDRRDTGADRRHARSAPGRRDRALR